MAKAKKASQKPEGYQGWTNYQTWAVALWISNEEPSYRYWRAAGKEALREHGKRDAACMLARRLESEIEDTVSDAADKLAGMLQDILTHAVAHTDWHAIAEDILSE